MQINFKTLCAWPDIQQLALTKCQRLTALAIQAFFNHSHSHSLNVFFSQNSFLFIQFKKSLNAQSLQFLNKPLNLSTSLKDRSLSLKSFN